MRPGLKALLLGAAVFLIYNANGREIGTYDSQPTKFLARQIVANRTLTLDRVVDATPAYAARPGFAKARDGHFRSAYSLAPAFLAAAVGWLASRLGLIDFEAPLAPALVAKVTASLLVTVAVVTMFYVARKRCSDRIAMFIAIGLALGTNLWAVASQTLWQHETSIAATAAALLLFCRGEGQLTTSRVAIASALLGVAVWSRVQMLPSAVILIFGLLVRTRRSRLIAACLPFAIVLGPVFLLNVLWFGSPFGGAVALELLHPSVHGVSGTFSAEPWNGALGLLVSPSRGLLVFSPIVLAAAAGIGPVLRQPWREDGRWCLAAAVLQFVVYAFYTVWWGGHTYGPRYCLDVLPFLVPLVGAGGSFFGSHALSRVLLFAALGWSLLLAATGAFCYPADQWNTVPDDVDTHHARLWDWRDPQFVRCWKRGFSPQNFGLLDRAAFRK